MALSLTNLQRWRDGLVAARFKGIREVQDQNGERVAFKSDSEMAKAIASADRMIAELQGNAPPSTILFRTSKGI